MDRFGKSRSPKGRVPAWRPRSLSGKYNSRKTRIPVKKAANNLKMSSWQPVGVFSDQFRHITINGQGEIIRPERSKLDPAETLFCHSSLSFEIERGLIKRPIKRFQRPYEVIHTAHL